VLFFVGCGEVVSSKKYDAHFFILQPISLLVEDSLSKKDIGSLLLASGFTINENSPLHVEITANPLKTNCALTSSAIAKENFIRISVLENGKERYRIQRNQKEEISLVDIEKVVKKMRDDLVK